MNLLFELNKNDIWLALGTGDAIKIDAPQGVLTGELRDQIKNNKTELIAALKKPWKRIDYQITRLAGELPRCYEHIGDGKIRATYHTRLELSEHLDRVSLAQMVNVATDLGGVVTGTVANDELSTTEIEATQLAMA